ncbi:DUF2339 domain-containing protein [Vibrio sp. J1-1]|uniref:DUF2339 domain-containing protein n=1 Tax=Vibrio sp. J1-1 TaxID=2912251 RepID=UPI001F451DEA|nr:DUF2339 domain-containing protein [Vibrio sp. J1-1]MCF7480665.1 DUF2339 domain-containing protein [Vibrio sp. J1-1]
MLTSLAVIMAFFALLITLKAVKRISNLEDKITQLHKELSDFRSRWLDQQSQPNTGEMPSPVASEITTETSSQTEIHYAGPSQSQAELGDTLESPAEPLFAQQTNQEDIQIASLASDDASQWDKQTGKLLSSIQENWLVWVGALAMLIGGGYLVQVIGSHIEFSPFIRVAFAFTLSFAMIAAGEWFHRKEQCNPERAKRAQGFTYVPAAITGTGLTGVYCTVIFAFVVYQMLTPSISLLILAAAAFSSLALSLRQGPLMAVLGLIGGYTAPLWISGTDPDYFLLAGYISAISIAATLLMQKVRRAWISPGSSIPHTLWMLILIESIPTESLFSWSYIYLSLTLYLIYAVPRLGWTLNPRYRHCQNKWTSPPIITSLAIVLLTFSAITRMPELNVFQMAYCYILLVATIWLPALREGWSMRVFLPSILVSTTAILVVSIAFDTLYMSQSEASILLALALSIVFVVLRTYLQGLNDRSPMSSILLLTLAPSMTLIVLFYAHEFMHSHAWYWTFYTALIAVCYVHFGLRLRQLAYECSAVIHVIIAGCSFVWLSDTWLTTAISAQVALMALQIQAGYFRPASWAVKIMMGALVVRLTLLPFIPEWQPVETGHWAWVLLSYLPALVILAYARSVLTRTDVDLANWFEGAFLHVFLMALFTQTNYWLTGQYGYLGHIDFTSTIVFANQALVMGFVYSYRSQFAQQLTYVYQTYSYLLWSIFALMTFLLNTIESPLNVDNVSAQAIPVFNMLSLGWLLPACVLTITVSRKWNTLRIHPHVISSIGFTLAALWLGMSIRQFWQTSSMTLYQPTSMAELFSYSVAGLLVGGLLTWAGVMRKSMNLQHIGLIILACVALKVFLWDVRSLDGFWRAISFLGLGASLIALGWLFQKFNRSVSEPSKP